jgi:dihydrofolate synthase / folylpolyglutamate synthase
MSGSWSPEHAERHLRSLELFGMRFGLDRVRRMMTVLESPERSFDSIHVVGTNGKTSTTRMIAAILERHGLRSGCFTSPHLVSYAERVQVAEREIEPHAFAAAITHSAWAAERVNRTLSENDHVTQFELLTAAALWELSHRGVQVAVIEAGLGGRYDATNVIDSRVAVLTNVGLEHTRWLGPTVRDIANEKLAVLSPGSTLVLGAGVTEEVRALADCLAAQRSARVLVAQPTPLDLPMRAQGSFQRENFALARLAAQAYLESVGLELHEDGVHRGARPRAGRGTRSTHPAGWRP